MRDHQPENVTKVYLTLDGLDIKYDSINHKPLFTVEEAAAIDGQINGIPCKNLLTTDKHGNFFLALLQDTKRLDLKNSNSWWDVSTYLLLARKICLEYSAWQKVVFRHLG